MNRAIFTLLLDYLRRTLGMWVLVVFVQLMQMSAIWVFRIGHVPIVGVVLASLAFSATWDSPHVLMRTLPIKRRDVALLRWWERIGVPMPFVVLAFTLAWFSNTGSRFPTPPFLSLWVPVAASFATLGVLSVLPMPLLSAARSNMAAFAAVWLAAVIAGLYGLPLQWLPEPLPLTLLSCGSLLALLSLSLARSGRVLEMPPLSSLFTGWRSRWRETPAGLARFRGWPVLVSRWIRTTFLLAFVSVVVVSIVRSHVHVLKQVLPWLFASATGAVSALLGRNWLFGVRALQCLPIRNSRLALIVCLALMMPAIIASVAATAVNAIVPEWGLAMPLYMLPVFALLPAMEMSWHTMQTNHPVPSSVQQWAPIMHIVMWPVWTGAFMSLELVRVLPAWFEIIAVGIAVALAAVAYGVVFYRLRSGAGLEHLGDPLAPR